MGFMDSLDSRCNGAPVKAGEDGEEAIAADHSRAAQPDGGCTDLM